MPQMAPMFWTLLMAFFTLSFIVFMVKLYFYAPSNTPKGNDSARLTPKKNWSW
uniref:ATP synthase complex subunit 8 n=1 Tax=Proasellus grafi TaxID=1281973 RepID=A0A485ME77_9CRUS|nr:ATP synthase 8 [Proasellus grafi]